jgi:basic membrane protein A and related proteins
MNRNYLMIGTIAGILVITAVIAIVSVLPHEPSLPVVYIVYDAEKGDLSYTDSAYRGLFAAQEVMKFNKKEFSSINYSEFSGLLDSLRGPEKPGLIITIGYDKEEDTRRLAKLHPEIRFLAIDQTGIGSDTVKAYEITSYGESYLAGVLAASATKNHHVGIILGTQSGLLEGFRQGYITGVHAVDPSMTVEQGYVRDNSTSGFSDPDRAAEIAGSMYRNGTDVIFTVAGYSGTGAIREAKAAPGRYIIGVDSDQAHLGPGVVLASAVKRVDRAVYSGIVEYLNGSFKGGEQTAGLKEGATVLSFNPKFAGYASTVQVWEAKAQNEEVRYLATRILPAQK